MMGKSEAVVDPLKTLPWGTLDKTGMDGELQLLTVVQYMVRDNDWNHNYRRPVMPIRHSL